MGLKKLKYHGTPLAVRCSLPDHVIHKYLKTTVEGAIIKNHWDLQERCPWPWEGGRTGWSLRAFPAQTILWFHCFTKQTMPALWSGCYTTIQFLSRLWTSGGALLSNRGCSAVKGVCWVISLPQVSGALSTMQEYQHLVRQAGCLWRRMKNLQMWISLGASGQPWHFFPF